MRRLGFAATLAVALALGARSICGASATFPETISGIAPSYGPRAVAAVPNAPSIVRRVWLPGLDGGYDPQGLAVDGNTIYVSGYSSLEFRVHHGPCRVTRIDAASGRPTGYIDVPSPCGHAGGLALGGDGFLYVADTHMLFVVPVTLAFSAGRPQFRRLPLGSGMSGALAASTADGIWLGTYREHEQGKLFHFRASILAALHDGDTLEASKADTVLPIPDSAQGAAISGGTLWVARSDWNWGTLDRLDPNTGAMQQRYQVAPGIEGIAFDNLGRLWAVSEAGARHYFDHALLRRIEPFFPLVFALNPARLQ